MSELPSRFMVVDDDGRFAIRGAMPDRKRFRQIRHIVLNKPPLLKPSDRLPLTAHQLRVVRLALEEGTLSAKYLAYKLGISPQTVKVHFGRIRQRLRARSMFHAALIVERLERQA